MLGHLMRRLLCAVLALLLAVSGAHAQLALTGAGKGVAGSAPSGLTCGTTSDNFNDGTKGAFWAATAAAPTTYGIGGYTLAGSATEGSGVVTVNGFSASTAQYQGYSSASTVTLASGTSIWVKPVPTGNITAVLALQTGASFFTRLEIDHLNGNISAANNNAGSGSTFWGSGASVPYSSTNHAWIGLRNTGSAIEAMTAPDASGSPGTWTAQGATTSGYGSPANVTVGLWAVANNATPGSVTFEAWCTDTP